MGKLGGAERQVVMYDPHSSQRALVYDENKDMQRAKRLARRRWLRSCCCLLVALAVLLLVLLFLALIIWLTLKPKPPKLSLHGITLHDMKVLDVNGTTMAGKNSTNAGNHTMMYLNSTLFIMATNPNRVSVGYSALQLNTTYNDLALDSVSMPPFRLQAHDNISIAAPFFVNMAFAQADGRDLISDAQNNHLPLQLSGQTTAKMFIVGFKYHLQLNMDCDVVIQYQDLKVQSNVCQTKSSKL